jgi:hypothetical protein
VEHIVNPYVGLVARESQQLNPDLVSSRARGLDIRVAVIQAFLQRKPAKILAVISLLRCQKVEESAAYGPLLAVFRGEEQQNSGGGTRAPSLTLPRKRGREWVGAMRQLIRP